MTSVSAQTGADGDARCRLYLITPPALGHSLDIATFAPALEAALDAGDTACLQLRMKGVDDEAIKEAAQALMPVCHSRDVAFIMNDRADLAAEVAADGVHIGAEGRRL